MHVSPTPCMTLSVLAFLAPRLAHIIPLYVTRPAPWASFHGYPYFINDSACFSSLDQVAGPFGFNDFICLCNLVLAAGGIRVGDAPPTFSPEQVACSDRSASISATAFPGRTDGDCESLRGD
jgi:hypothetical protein